MQINSYTFQSPYSQPFQIGRPDPSSSKENQVTNTLADSKEKNQVADAKLSPTKQTNISIPISALTNNNTQNEVSMFQLLSSSIQAQKAYTQ